MTMTKKPFFRCRNSASSRRLHSLGLLTEWQYKSACIELVHQWGICLMNNAAALTDRFDRALLYATHVHGGQVRKGTSTPYIAHLMAVAATVLEYGGDEDLAIAALLHDSVEDQGGSARLEDVRNRFGERVAGSLPRIPPPRTVLRG